MRRTQWLIKTTRRNDSSRHQPFMASLMMVHDGTVLVVTYRKPSA